MKNNEHSYENNSIQPSFSVDMNSVIQPPTPWCSTVKWGAHHSFDIKLSNSIVYSCFPLTDYYTNIGSNTSIQGRINDFVAITSNSIIRFDSETRAIKEISKQSYCAGVYIPIHDVIVAVSATTSHFNFIRPEDMKHPIESEFRSMQFPCFHINFLKKSHVLVTAGNDIRIWNLKCVLPSRNIITIKPQISITLRATIEIGFEFNYLNSPCIDYLNELIILPRGSGFSAYNIDGQLVKEMSKLPTTPQTLVSFLPNEDLEIDKNKRKKLSNQQSSKKLYHENTYLSNKNSQTNDDKNDSNQTDNSVLVTADSDHGVCEWTPNATLKKRHTSGNSKIIALRLINKSFFLYIDIKNKIYIVDMLARTPRMFLVANSSEKPLSMILFRTNSVSSADQFGLALCINTTISIYQIVVPWKLFAPSLIKPALIRLCPRRNRAARIQVQTSNSDLYLLSPKTAQSLTSAAPNNPKKIIDTLYDRGLFINEARDQLIVVVENGEIVCFSTANIPCDKITSIDYHAAAVFLAYAKKSIFSNGTNDLLQVENENNNELTEKENQNDENPNEETSKTNENELCYCVATQNGEIFLCDYNSFKCKKRYIIQTGIVKTAKYDVDYGTVIMSYLNMLLRFDIQNGVILEKLKQVPSGVVTCLEKGILLIGYESGKIAMIKIREKTMEIMKSEGISYHTSAVTGFAFGTNFFLSSSTDQSIKIWSLKGENVGSILLPLPLYGIEIFNGKRDILVGTDKEIMVIEGRSIFLDEFERKDDILDNYNEKDDELTNDAISPLQIQEEEKQAFLIARKAEEQEAENKNRKKEEETKSNYSTGIVYLNNQNNRNINNRMNNKTEINQKREIDEQTRKRIIEQMTKITANSTLSTRIAEREKMLLAQKTQQIEDEYKQEKEIRGYSLEEQEIALKKRKEETILRRKREQEERERIEREKKEKEERERREKKEKEERERKEREEKERKEREERERKEKEEQERKEREERERLEREEQERLEREEQERLEREEKERQEQEERERLEQEEQERLEREEQERLEREEKERKEKEEREEKERLEREEKERLEKEEKERKEKEEKEKELQRIFYFSDEDDDPLKSNSDKKQKNDKKEKKDKKSKKKNKSSSPSKSPKNKQKEKNKETNDDKDNNEDNNDSSANVINFPNALIQEEKPKEDSKTKSKSKSKEKEKEKTVQSKQKDPDNESNKEDDENLSQKLPFKIELAKWISSDGKVFLQNKKGDWTDEQQRLFQKQPNGSFITTDSIIWCGPSVQKGRFVVAKGGKNFDQVGQRFFSCGNKKIYTNLGEDQFSDSDGLIYIKGKDGKFFTENKKKSWNGPDGNGFFEKMNKPKQITGSDGKIYKLNKKGDYVCAENNDKSNKNKKNNKSTNQSFVTNDGVLMIMIDNDTFLGSDGAVYRSDESGKIVNPESGKSYEKKIRPPEPEPEPEPKPEPKAKSKKSKAKQQQQEQEQPPQTQTQPQEQQKDATDNTNNNNLQNEQPAKKADGTKSKKKKGKNKKGNNNKDNVVNENETKKEDENKEEKIEKSKEDEIADKEVNIENKDNEKEAAKTENKEEEKPANIENKEEEESNEIKEDKNEEEEKEENIKDEEEEKEDEDKSDIEEEEKDDDDESEKESKKEEESENEEDEKESQKDEEESEKEEESQNDYNEDDDDDDESGKDDEENEDEDENDAEDEDEYDESDESEGKAKKIKNKKKAAANKEAGEAKTKDSSKGKAKETSKNKAGTKNKANKEAKDSDKKKTNAKSKSKSKNEDEEIKNKEVLANDENENENENQANENDGEELQTSINDNNNDAEIVNNEEETINENELNNNEEEEINNQNEINNNEEEDKNENVTNNNEEEEAKNENELNNNEEEQINNENVLNNNEEEEAKNETVANNNEEEEAKNENELNNEEEQINNENAINNEEEESKAENNENEPNETESNDNNDKDNNDARAEENEDENGSNAETAQNENENDEQNESNTNDENNENEQIEDNANNEEISNTNNEENENDSKIEDTNNDNAEELNNNEANDVQEEQNENANDANENIEEDVNNNENDAENNNNENEANNDAETGDTNAEAEEDANQDEINENGDNDESNIKIDSNDGIQTPSNIDVFKPGEVYKSHDGNEYEKTDDGTFVDKSGKSFKLNENGDFAAEDGTVMPLSNEELFYAEPNGTLYRPLPSDENQNENEESKPSNKPKNAENNSEPKWINSEGKVFTPTDEPPNSKHNKKNNQEITNSNEPTQNSKENDQQEKNDDDYDNDYNEFNDYDEGENRPISKKLVADDGTVWNGPNPATGKFGGKKIKKTPVQWVQNDGLVFIPTNKDKSEWTSSENKKFAKLKDSDPLFERVDDRNQKETWEGPVTGMGHWVSGNGNVIDSDKGIWLSPDKKVYTAVKTGYVQNDNGRLYKPFITSQGAAIDKEKRKKASGKNSIDGDKDNLLVSDDGKDLLKIGEKEGQFISNNGEIYTSVDDDGKEWIDNYGVVYRPNNDGSFLVSSETQQKWQGPPFFSNRNLVKNQFNGFKHDPIKLKYPAALTLPKRDVVYTNYDVKIGQPRSSTPLYKAPPLKYPPIMHSKYKPFRFRPKTPPGDNGYFFRKFNNPNENPRRNKLRILNPHAIPPPNIVIDEQQVIRLIERGQRQLIPLLRRIATEHPSKKLARDYLRMLDAKRTSQNNSFYDDGYDDNENEEEEDLNSINKKYRGKFNIKFNLDLDAMAPTPISNLNKPDSKSKTIRPPETQKTKSARSFVHYNNVLNPMNNEQDYLNLYMSRSKGRSKRRNNEEDDRYISIDNSYSSNGFYQTQREPKANERTRPFSVHNPASDKHVENTMITQRANKPKLFIPQSARRQKK